MGNSTSSMSITRLPNSPAPPRAISKLKRFDPITLPSAISPRLCKMLAPTETISGKEVPIAIMVSPINASLQPESLARAIPPLTNSSAPKISAAMPPKL